MWNRKNYTRFKKKYQCSIQMSKGNCNAVVNGNEDNGFFKGEESFVRE